MIRTPYELALDRAWPEWSAAAIRARCTLVRAHGQDFSTLYLDGKPLLVFTDARVSQEFTGSGWRLTVSQEMRPA